MYRGPGPIDGVHQGSPPNVTTLPFFLFFFFLRVSQHHLAKQPISNPASKSEGRVRELRRATQSYPRYGIAGIEEGAIPNPNHRRAQKQHSYQRDHKQQLIRELRTDFHLFVKIDFQDNFHSSFISGVKIITSQSIGIE